MTSTGTRTIRPPGLLVGLASLDVGGQDVADAALHAMVRAVSHLPGAVMAHVGDCEAPPAPRSPGSGDASMAAEGNQTGVPGITLNPEPHAATRFVGPNGVAVMVQTAS
jgi:hypothetical protein